ncbi:RDD family protein [Paradevosia shaoguanensis]|uniref:RDD family protein n=1 Tax=Paradevosia shaoguanensis TaxID=1335043 RepID=A0AA41UAW8_9HYPH|nr:RDD family protein [Paradevosia shaoguanensis]MCF1742277.1 RDD family protein [Paradevosia shaoguanensis]MCI0126760.1 RDD family protein [Paradevosia shaoguanensis]QMV02344.1 RDD family protein [Devosia sp. D6-9]
MNAALPDPDTAPELFEGVLTRRMMAFVVDMVIISMMVFALAIVGGIAGFLTFGLAWLGLIVLLPLSIVLYYAATLGSPRRATVGMQMMDIVLTPTRASTLDGGMAVLHALLFWVSVWIFWPISLGIALFTPRRQMLHDLILGTLMVRRSPMTRHWASYQANAGRAF